MEVIKKIMCLMVIVLFFAFVRPDETPEMWQVALMAVLIYEALQIKIIREEGDSNYERDTEERTARRA